MRFLLIVWIMMTPPNGALTGMTSIASDEPDCADAIKKAVESKVDGYVCVLNSDVHGLVRRP